jgi:hypothetical protein
MKDRRLWRRVWRAAHAIGAASLFALAAMLFLSLPARAQAPQMDGVEPCLATHFDPSRYLAELGALGWQPIADDARGAALAWLSDAFLPLAFEGFDYADATDAAGRRAEQVRVWDDMTRGRNILVRGQQVLFIGGDSAADGRRRISCWLAAASGDPLTSRLFDIWSEVGLSVAGPTVTRAGIPDTPLAGGGTLSVRGVRTLPGAFPGLSAHEGLLIRVVLDAEATQ